MIRINHRDLVRHLEDAAGDPLCGIPGKPLDTLPRCRVCIKRLNEKGVPPDQASWSVLMSRPVSVHASDGVGLGTICGKVGSEPKPCKRCAQRAAKAERKPPVAIEQKPVPPKTTRSKALKTPVVHCASKDEQEKARWDGGPTAVQWERYAAAERIACTLRVERDAALREVARLRLALERERAK